MILLFNSGQVEICLKASDIWISFGPWHFLWVKWIGVCQKGIFYSNLEDSAAK